MKNCSTSVCSKALLYATRWPPLSLQYCSPAVKLVRTVLSR
jgi:hypothetical protein